VIVSVANTSGLGCVRQAIGLNRDNQQIYQQISTSIHSSTTWYYNRPTYQKSIMSGECPFGFGAPKVAPAQCPFFNGLASEGIHNAEDCAGPTEIVVVDDAAQNNNKDNMNVET
jgi:hypothetical protein